MIYKVRVNLWISQLLSKNVLSANKATGLLQTVVAKNAFSLVLAVLLHQESNLFALDVTLTTD
jgi:hypothetical protein